MPQPILENPMTTFLETCEITPPPSAADELTLPLSYLDILWLHFHPIRRLLFYEYPCSKLHFEETIVPELKQSLSLTLKHYLPAAGNLLYPLECSDKKPLFRYISGDSVSLIISESSSDFDALIANHQRDSDQFYDFMPQMPPVKDEEDYKIVPLLALQVTLFPNRGICFGFSNHHALGDGSSIARFVWAWASINKLNGDSEFVKTDELLPNFDRSCIKDPLGIDSIFWKVFAKMPFNPSSSFPIPTNRVRGTFILRPADLQKLKQKVLEKNPDLTHVSSFVVTTTYIWSCIVKSGDAVGEELGGDEEEFFGFPVDARGQGRADPPIPANYFGNCLGFGLANVDRRKLAEDDGFVTGAAAVAEEIKNKVNKNGELLKGAENWVELMGVFLGRRVMGVSGSPKFDLGKADFGWGKVRKLEVLNIDEEKYSISLCNPKDSDGGLEVGLSLPKERMEVFATVFEEGLRR